MDIKTKFDLQQEVWIVTTHSARRIVSCDVCEKGKLKIGQEEFVCPKCSGRSAYPQYAGNKAVVYYHGRIGKIQTEYYGPNAYHYSDRPVRHTYMIDTTGIGSGTVHDEENVFATEAEAQEYCDRHNGVLNLVNEAKELPALI